MRAQVLTAFLFAAAQSVSAQYQIWDFWQTTWQKNPLFQYNPSSAPKLPINFTNPGSIGSADIVIDDSSVFQTIHGFGATLTDGSALTLNNLKSTNSGNYWSLLKYMFDPTDGANAAGLSYLRVALGASDFSSKLYSFDDSNGDTSLNNFNISRAPSYLFSVIKDIMSINSILKVHVLPWSPPGWMKDSGTMNGGSINTNYETVYANYLLRSLQGLKNQGIPVYAISIQNEPENSNPTYPTCSMPYWVEAAIAQPLRTLMNNNGFLHTKLIGYEHNWDHAAEYPVQLMQTAGDSFDGVAFHCYAGDVSYQQQFTSAYPNKEVYFTECSGTIGSDWWSDIKWYINNLWLGSLQYGSSSGLMWNIAADGNGNPKLPGTSSCGDGCRPLVTVNSDGSYSFNQEFYSMAQVSKAVIPRDVGGEFGRRIGVSVGGNLNWALVVGAFVTPRVSPTDWDRYSLVVLNWNDNASSGWNPQSVQTTIEFRGMQAAITFPVGITTLWWYAPKTSLTGNEQPFDGHIYADTAAGQQQPMGMWRNGV